MNAGWIRVGQGFDIHRFSDDPTRVLVLGGSVFDGERGLEGHSDADVISHACSDALLGAAGLGDIGMHFPDTDQRWKGADSLTLLRHVMSLVGQQRWSVANIDCAVVCERPKLAPRRDEMQATLTQIVGAPVTIKGNRAERLGAIGRDEGIACFATALLVHDDAADARDGTAGDRDHDADDPDDHDADDHAEAAPAVDARQETP
ncbi:2-C-methyl-D-erythritol 2,4-cyclodiphosphate synthase [Ilumatobacter sp.]|uniref:2-C-methyl-D-erythritol 2,4-cyclodiphosphate synthase n=1 Tax=Ilumatobacter sp. TaxID=1967498 RepID=UPI00329794FF